MRITRLKALLLGILAAAALTGGVSDALANSATITLTTNGPITATSSGLLTLNDNGFGSTTCNVSLTGTVTSGIYTSAGTSLAKFGVITGAAATNCNQSLTVTGVFPVGGWSLNFRANDITLNTTGKINNWNIAAGGVGVRLSGAAVGGTVTYGGTANPGILTPQLNNSSGTIYPVTQGTPATANQANLSNAIGGNTLNSDAGTTAAFDGSLSFSPAGSLSAVVTSP